jgi:hypothetical protein
LGELCHQQGKGFMSLLIFFARRCDNHQLINIETWKRMMKFPPQKLADDLLDVITVEGDGNLFSSLYRFSPPIQLNHSSLPPGHSL